MPASAVLYKSLPLEQGNLPKEVAMNKFKKSLCSAFAASIVLTGAASMAPMALAQGDAEPSAPLHELPVDQLMSLTIHKFANNTPGDAGNGMEITDTADLGEALEGAEFQVERVNDIDLTTQAGWVAAEQIAKGAVAPESLSYGTPVSQTTGPDGIAQFSDLEIGLYRVTETQAPDGYRISTQPFFVALPLTHPTELNSWMTDVHVYPKNNETADQGVKTVNDAEAFIDGDVMHYTITQPLEQRSESSAPRARYIISDFYDEARISPDLQSIVVEGYEAGTDYSVVTDTAGVLKIEFTEAGLAKIDENSRAQGGEVVVSIDFEVLNPEDTSEIVNRFKVIDEYEGDPTDPEDPNEPPTDPDPEDPDQPEWPKSYFGNLDIAKQTSDGTRIGGAEFDLYTCDAQSTLSTDPIRTGIVADDSEQPEINQLRVNDWVNNQFVNEEDRSFYCLVETKAPEGFELNVEPIQFQVLRGEQTESIALTTVNVTDVERNAGFALPLTGGTGIAILILAGGALFVIGRGYSLYINRRQA